MIIPPFPSHDLAKLVLGYLAEEQLMTAYDEFLQASPYLNALGNEYDRIFMTSLKNILAEYRAVKIHVETCKPFVLRKKLLQCPNLLEIVKFLIQNVDINKLLVQENQNKSNLPKDIDNASFECEMCKAKKQDTCLCNKKHNVSKLPTRIHNEPAYEKSVETTPLSDLPGSHVKCRKKTQTPNASLVNDAGTRLHGTNTLSSYNAFDQSGHNNISNPTSGNVLTQSANMLHQKEEFNTILNQVCNNKQSIINEDLNETQHDKQLNTGYINFSTGVHCGSAKLVEQSLPTPEITQSQQSTCIPGSNTTQIDSNKKAMPIRTQYLLKVASVKNAPNEILSISTLSNRPLPRLKPKPEETKVKIISDVKVNNSYTPKEISGLNMPPVLKNATSTPLLQMQTIVINGTQVFKQTPLGQTNNYTKDEIMAMPTIILAPAPGASEPTSTPKAFTATTMETTLKTSKNSNTAKSLEPLTIEITDAASEVVKEKQNLFGTDVHKETATTVHKLCDVTSSSVPKDNIVVGNLENSTPQVLPPLRKSSSTPRRTSHVRVLDFTTPRRILHEAANKCVPTSEEVEVVVRKSPNTSYTTTIHTEKKPNVNLEDNETSKENTIKQIFAKKSSWDTDLRALAIINEQDSDESKSRMSNTKSTKKKKSYKKQPTSKKSSETPTAKKRTPKGKTPKQRRVTIAEDFVRVEKANETTIKPTINIISGTDRHPPENEKSQNKSNNVSNETPELERISLQNEIGAKLNISDLLETPYKQALYDIQMETPRFFGPELPDDPMSDIKIMNIPTPRFLNAPTPSSYSSRPTDYSSGGSYYKPDDQDYILITDEITSPVSSTQKDVDLKEAERSTSDVFEEKHHYKSSRPVRQCRKNVSYYNSSNIGKHKDVEGKELHTSLSDIEANNSNLVVSECKSKVKPQKIKQNRKVIKKRKTPVKKDTSKAFIKIKAKRITPIKISKDLIKGKKKTPESTKSVARRKTDKKECAGEDTPAIVPVSTKSRRKSSTPRKLHCTKTFNAQSLDCDSSESTTLTDNEKARKELIATPDSEAELPLRWSDDGSQESKLKDNKELVVSSEIEDITKIQEYINTVTNIPDINSDEGTLHNDLVKRGFDSETARIIERELLDGSPSKPETVIKNDIVQPVADNEINIDNTGLEKSIDLDASTSNNLQIDEGEDDDEIQLTVCECNEESINFVTYFYDDTKELIRQEVIKLKDKFSMEVCMDDDVSIRLRATPFSLLLDQDPTESLNNQDHSETERAVASITNINNFYTPVKEAIKAQCYEIFDSTLTSIDTPLKVATPKSKESQASVTEIVLEVEKVVERVEVKDKTDTKKRKRVQSGNISDENLNDTKKVKPETQYIFNSANIQNIDIESVLSKLHGP